MGLFKIGLLYVLELKILCFKVEAHPQSLVPSTSAAGPFGASIAQVIRQAKPDRLLIEPSGLGHPAGISMSTSFALPLQCGASIDFLLSMIVFNLKQNATTTKVSRRLCNKENYSWLRTSPRCPDLGVLRLLFEAIQPC